MIFRAQMSFPVDSTLPADAMSITPHFFGDDAQALADRLKANLTAWTPVGALKPFSIRIYDAQKPPPSYPLATASQAGTPPGSGVMVREVALCMSYYSTWNRPRYRGRLYLPSVWVGGQMGSRPTAGQMTIALGFKDVLTGGLPTGHNWVVYSPTNNQSYGVTNAWVDDEWDIVRSRGRKPTTRQEATVP